MFAGKEKKRIVELLADLDALVETLGEAQDERAEWQRTSGDWKALAHEHEAHAQDQIKALKHAYALEVAALNGRIQELTAKGAKYDGIVNRFAWHSGGKVEVEGKRYLLMEARTDNPLMNFRIPVPEGQEFP